MSAPIRVAIRLVVVLGMIVGISWAIGDAARNLEARLVASFLARVFGVDVMSIVDGAILVEQFEAAPVVARVTLSCSATIGIVTFFAINSVFMRGRPRKQRLLGFAVASAIWGGVNLVRISGAVITAERWGPESFEIFHNWIGTAMAVAGALVALMFMVSAYLPSSRELRGN